MNPNDLMRGRFRRLDPAQHLSLSDEERADIVRNVRSQGPALIQRARQRILIARAVGASVALAAAVVLIAVLPSWREQGREANVAAPARPTTACASDASGTRRFVSDASGRQVLELGRALAIAEKASSVALAELAPCHTVLTLASGTLTVHARDLGGGELKVRSHDREVIVRGTLFRVDTGDSSLRVAVEHGRVTVHERGEVVATVHANQTVRITASGPETAALSPQEREALRASIAPSPSAEQTAQQAAETAARDPLLNEVSKEEGVANARADDMSRPRLRKVAPSKVPREAPVASAPTHEEMFVEAEARWRSGDKRAARELYARVGSSRSPIAETAWLRMARLELDQGDAKAALRALAGRKKHLGGKELGAEAAWLEVEALAAAGRYDDAESAARQLIERFPTSPQASAARRLLAKTAKP